MIAQASSSNRALSFRRTLQSARHKFRSASPLFDSSRVAACGREQNIVFAQLALGSQLQPLTSISARAKPPMPLNVRLGGRHARDLERHDLAVEQSQ